MLLELQPKSGGIMDSDPTNQPDFGAHYRPGQPWCSIVALGSSCCTNESVKKKAPGFKQLHLLERVMARSPRCHRYRRRWEHDQCVCFGKEMVLRAIVFGKEEGRQRR